MTTLPDRSANHDRRRAGACPPPRATGDARGSARLAALALLVVATAACGGDDGGAPHDTLPRLSARGRDIVDPDGNVVKLRGVNLGAWLFHENWITSVDYPLHGRVWVLAQEAGVGDEVAEALRAVGPASGGEWLDRLAAELDPRIGTERRAALYAELARYPVVYDDSDRFMRELLEERFGPAGRDELLDVFWGAWIREEDVAWVAAQGLNVLRVPITYRSLVQGSDRTPPDELVWNERAFARIDELLAWCNRHGLWAVLDVQESIGGHNDYSGPAELYANPRYLELTVELWTELSRRYGQRSVVAAFSLLAEPFGAPSTDARDDAYDAIVQAIRARGDDHLLVIHDGFFGIWTLPDPASRGWENVVYSTHLFEFGISSALEYQLLFALYDVLFNQAQARQDVPYYIGSFSPMDDADYAYRGAQIATDLFNRSGWSWSLWTLKRIDDPVEAALYGTSTSWGLLGRLASPLDRPDLHRDSFETLERKLGAYADVALEPNPRLRDVIAAAAAAP